MFNNSFSSPNFSNRKQKIHFIILHYTEIPFIQALSRLCDPITQVSSHYFIKNDGEIFRLVDDQNIAWHAGVSAWQNFTKLNEHSIGIELDNSGREKFPAEQLATCVNLCKILMAKYNISKANILGHSDIAPERKIDPGIYFDWQYLADRGIGIWPQMKYSYLNKLQENEKLFHFGYVSPKIFDLQCRIQKLGYPIRCTGIFDLQTNYVIRSFQAHFYPQIILQQGIDYYHNNYSKYIWDVASDQILDDLLNDMI